MTLREELIKLRTQTSRVAAIEFKQGPTDIIEAVIGKKRKFVRDARPDENKLAAMCVGESALQEVLPAVSNVPERASHESITRLLSSLRALSEVCKDPVAAKKIQELERIAEQKELNIQYLRKTIAKNDIEIKVYERICEQQGMDTDEEEYNDDEEKDGEEEDSEEIRREEAEIQRLETLLKQKKEQRKEIARKKEEQLEIQRKMREMANRQAAQQSSATHLAQLKEVERLQKEIKIKKQRIAEYDRLLAEQDANPSAHIPLASQREAYTGLRAKIEQLFTSSVGNGEASSSATELIDTFKLVETELKDILSRMESVDSTDKQNDVAKSISLKLLNYVNKQINSDGEEKPVDKDQLEQFNKLFPHNTHTTIPVLKPTKDTQILAPVLLKLFNQDEMTLSDLTTYVEEVAREKGVADKEAVRLIYKLSSMDLIVIDRTLKDSTVRLNFTTTQK